jgi:hypothetical protein
VDIVDDALMQLRLKHKTKLRGRYLSDRPDNSKGALDEFAYQINYLVGVRERWHLDA